MTDGLRQPRYPRWFKVLRCVVCGYPYSDMHHVIPVGMGGQNGTRIALCPNHHRFAHIVYAWILAGWTSDRVKEAAAQRFDTAFNEKALHYLTYTFSTFLDATWQAEAVNIVRMMLQGAKIVRKPQFDFKDWAFDYSGPWYLAWPSEGYEKVNYGSVWALVADGYLSLEEALQEELIAWMFRRKYFEIIEEYYLEDGLDVILTDLGRQLAEGASS